MLIECVWPKALQWLPRCLLATVLYRLNFLQVCFTFTPRLCIGCFYYLKLILQCLVQVLWILRAFPVSSLWLDLSAPYSVFQCLHSPLDQSLDQRLPEAKVGIKFYHYFCNWRVLNTLAINKCLHFALSVIFPLVKWLEAYNCKGKTSMVTELKYSFPFFYCLNGNFIYKAVHISLH